MLHAWIAVQAHAGCVQQWGALLCMLLIAYVTHAADAVQLASAR